MEKRSPIWLLFTSQLQMESNCAWIWGMIEIDNKFHDCPSVSMCGVLLLMSKHCVPPHSMSIRSSQSESSRLHFYCVYYYFFHSRPHLLRKLSVTFFFVGNNRRGNEIVFVQLVKWTRFLYQFQFSIEYKFLQDFFFCLLTPLRR